MNPDNPRRSRPSIKADDPRIQRVFELRRKTGSGSKLPGDPADNPLDDKPDPPGLKTPDDSDQEDRHSDDEGFAKENTTGAGLKMQVSEKPRPDFQELKYEHLGGVCWEILTGIEARTKFTNSELRHEGMRAWFRAADCLLTSGVSRAHMEATAKLPYFDQQLSEFLCLAGNHYPGEKPFITENTSWPDSEETD